MSVRTASRTSVKLYIACESVIRKDVSSLSDPFVVVTMKKRGRPEYEIGRTETKKNNQSPVFEKTVRDHICHV